MSYALLYNLLFDHYKEETMSFNKIIIVGNLGRGPEMRYTPQGTPVCTFNVATNERRKDRTGEQIEIVTWFRVVVWGRRAENAAKYLSKGNPVYVEGRLHVEEWTDREGKPRHTLEVNAADVQFIGGSVEQAGPLFSKSEGGGEAPQQPDLSDDDIPF